MNDENTKKEKLVEYDFKDLVNKVVDKLDQKRKKKLNTVKIQPLEDYLEELGVKILDTKNPSEYKQIHKTDCKNDDVISVTPGLETSPQHILYASLLSKFYEAEGKKVKEKLKKQQLKKLEEKKRLEDEEKQQEIRNDQE